MKRSPLTVVTVMLGLVLAGQAGAAAEDDPSPTPSPATAPSTAPSAARANQPPVAGDDTATVDAGRTVSIAVLANDTDDGLGRPEGTPPRLEVVAASGADGVTFSADAVTFRAADGAPDQTVSLGYRVSDGELEATGHVAVRVRAAPVPRAVTIKLRKGLTAQRSYRIHGTVAPVGPGPVTVRVQRRTDAGRWVRYRIVRADRQGRYSVGYKPIRNKRKTFRAFADWPDHRHAGSGRISRWVFARPDVGVSGPLRRRQVPYSWRTGCPVPPRDLRMIHVNRFAFDNTIRRGAVVVHRSQVADVVNVLRAAFGKRFPIRRMNPADAYYLSGRRTPEQSDKAAMRHGNTSAFNCRPVTGNPYRISQHSYGNAIDINTITNPYVVGGRVYPSWARPYLDRSPYRKGMLLPGGVVATTMRRLGWLWGARWSHPDYQHFSSNGG